MTPPPTLNVTIGSRELILPSQDPWYAAPLDFTAYSPGTVLRVRTVSGSVPFEHTSKAYHILYRTTGSRYEPAWAVATLLIPKKPFISPSGHNALLSYQNYYNSATVDLSPSYSLFQPMPENGLGIPSGYEGFNEMLRRGWFVVVPDFEGPRACFGATVLAGHATLDAIRAVLSLAGNDDIPLPNDAGLFKHAMWGYSGGSIASEKAAELQVQYAPELSTGLVGAALGGLVSDIWSLYSVVNKTRFTGLLILILLGVMNEFPEVDAYIRSRLKPNGPQNATAFFEGRNMNALLAVSPFANQDIYGYFLNGRADLEESTIMHRIRKVEWMLGYHGAPGIPLFVYKAVEDEMTLIADTDRHMAHYERHNVSVLYERNTVGDHITEIINGEGRAIEWLASVFDGSYDGANQGVRVRDVAVDIYKPPVA